MSRYKTEDLKKMILDDKLPYEEIGRLYGVTGNAIKKAALRCGIELPVRRKVNEKETFNYRKPKMGVCTNCGKEFVGQPGKDRFCSNACKSAYRRKSGVDNVTRSCAFCGGPFIVNKYRT